MNSFSITATITTHAIPARIKVDQTLTLIALFSGLGLVISAYAISLGGDLSAVLLY